MKIKVTNYRANQTCSVKKCRDTEIQSMKENVRDGESCFLILRYCIRDWCVQRLESVLFH